ncbi:hypothetical protein Y10_11200 [Neptunitalea sp. Y10]|uniref:Lipoprotein n=2 Tax=Neptunitalea lumnitzerae TaxID=2965509 RepID=A0ABQ5MH87_9FLAO|nr:hypothetical protein Y10_11200 [Neptunitalea sp. Y10]
MLIAVLFFGCESDDNCTKTIQIPQYTYSNGQSYVYYTEQEVSCDFEEAVDEPAQTGNELENFTYEVLLFEYTQDTGNNSHRLQMEIKLNNSNNYAVTGYPYFSIAIDGMVTSSAYANLASENCLGIAANSSCVFTLDIEEDSTLLGAPSAMELVAVKYYVTE